MQIIEFDIVPIFYQLCSIGTPMIFGDQPLNKSWRPLIIPQAKKEICRLIIDFNILSIYDEIQDHVR
jgi:hypothetical protein